MRSASESVAFRRRLIRRPPRAGMMGLAGFVLVLWTMPPGETPVADAAMRNDVTTVRTLLQEGADVNAAQGDGMTALHWAARHDNVELARMLLYAGANLRATTRIGGYTPLLLAGLAGRAAMLDLLLEAGADPNTATTTGATALHLATATGEADAVRTLIAHGADVDAREAAAGQTPLMFAAAANRVAAMEVLLEHGANPGITTRVIDLDARAREDAAERRRHIARVRAHRAERATPAAAPDSAAGKKPSSDSTAAVRNPTGELREGPRPEAAGETPKAEASRATPDSTRTSQPVPTAQAEGGTPSGAGAEKKPAAPRPLSYAQLVGAEGGLSALHYAVRQGNRAAVETLLEAGADINEATAGDHTSPLLIATINGHFDLALFLLERGADPNLASAAGVTPLYAVINVQWAPHAFYPQPSPAQEHATHLEVMRALLDAGADPNVRLEKKVWYTGYNFDQSGVDESGATPFWRAAQASDVDAMRLLVEHGADPTVWSRVVPERRAPNGRNAHEDPTAPPPVPIGGPAVSPLHVATGAGYDGNFHRNAMYGWMPAVRYLVEELGFDVNVPDYKGYTPLHNAAFRGDNAMILYLVEHGADVTAVARSGQTTVDMANGPIQRLQPFPETIALLEGMGAKNNHRCLSC